jgi:hypothetical protein
MKIITYTTLFQLFGWDKMKFQSIIQRTPRNDQFTLQTRRNDDDYCISRGSVHFHFGKTSNLYARMPIGLLILVVLRLKPLIFHHI